MKLKAPFLLLFFLWISQVCVSQNWFKEDAHWVYSYLFHFEHAGYEEVFVEGDTLINNQSCKILKRKQTVVPISVNTQDTLIIHRSPHIVYEENDSVFYWNFWKSEFTLIYDFTMTVGNSMTIEMGDFNCNDSYYLTFEIVNVSTIDIGGVQRKRQIARIFKNFFQVESLTVQIIEGIGIVHGFFEFSNGSTYSGNHGYLIAPLSYPCWFDGKEWSFCAYDDYEIEEYNPAEVDCYELYTVSSNKEFFNSDIIVYPNPASDFLTFYSNETFSNNVKFQLINRLGKEVKNEILSNQQNEYSISVKGIQTGIYFYKIEVDEKTVTTGKVIIK